MSNSKLKNKLEQIKALMKADDSQKVQDPVGYYKGRGFNASEAKKLAGEKVQEPQKANKDNVDISGVKQAEKQNRISAHRQYAKKVIDLVNGGMSQADAMSQAEQETGFSPKVRIKRKDQSQSESLKEAEGARAREDFLNMSPEEKDKARLAAQKEFEEKRGLENKKRYEEYLKEKQQQEEDKAYDEGVKREDGSVPSTVATKKRGADYINQFNRRKDAPDKKLIQREERGELNKPKDQKQQPESKERVGELAQQVSQDKKQKQKAEVSIDDKIGKLKKLLDQVTDDKHKKKVQGAIDRLSQQQKQTKLGKSVREEMFEYKIHLLNKKLAKAKDEPLMPYTQYMSDEQKYDTHKKNARTAIGNAKRYAAKQAEMERQGKTLDTDVEMRDVKLARINALKAARQNAEAARQLVPASQAKIPSDKDLEYPDMAPATPSDKDLEYPDTKDESIKNKLPFDGMTQEQRDAVVSERMKNAAKFSDFEKSKHDNEKQLIKYNKNGQWSLGDK